MIALDSSSIVAVALAEAEAKSFVRTIGQSRCLVGWPTLFETYLVLLNRLRARADEFLDRFLAESNVVVVAFDRPLYAAACEAFDRFGKGRHPAKLNFGDCMAYAVAKFHDVPLLYKGDDFARTDVRPTLP